MVYSQKGENKMTFSEKALISTFKLLKNNENIVGGGYCQIIKTQMIVLIARVWDKLNTCFFASKYHCLNNI